MRDVTARGRSRDGLADRRLVTPVAEQGRDDEQEDADADRRVGDVERVEARVADARCPRSR